MQQDKNHDTQKATRTIERQGAGGISLPAVPVLKKASQTESRVVQRQLSSVEVIKLGDRGYKSGVGLELYNKVLGSPFTTAAQVHELFRLLKPYYPWHLVGTGFTPGRAAAKKIKDATPGLDAKITELIHQVLGASESTSSSSSSSSTATPSSSPSPWVISAPEEKKAFVVGPKSKAKQVTENPSVSSAKIRESGITPHGSFIKGSTKITKAGVTSYVRTNHSIAEFNGERYSIKLGVADDKTEWFITYKVIKGVAIIDHFGPFGSVTGGDYS